MGRSKNYMSNIRNACGIKLLDPEGQYSDREGHLRLAREVGYALGDFTDKEKDNILRSSYSSIYVIACNLQPTLDANEWINEMLKGLEKRNKKGD